eukprot:15207489-Ditylum_brightwellii.AAC.1
MSSGSGFSRASSSIFLSTPILPKIQKIANINEALYEEGYDTDGDKEEEAFPSREEFEAMVARAENPVNNNTNPVNNNTTHQGGNDDTIGDA